MDTGVARKRIDDLHAYKAHLSARRDPVAGTLNRIFERVRKFPKRVVFAEGEEEQVIRAAISYVNQGLGTAILVGREDRIHETAEAAGIDLGGREGVDTPTPACRAATPPTRASSTTGCSGRATCSATASA